MVMVPLISTKISETLPPFQQSSSGTPADSRDHGNIHIPHRSCWEPNTNRRQPWNVLHWPGFCWEVPPNVCLHCAPAVTNTPGSDWTWQHKKTSELTAPRKIRTSLVDSVLHLEPTTRSRSSGPDTPLTSTSVLLVTAALGWRLTVVPGLGLGVLCPLPCLMIVKHWMHDGANTSASMRYGWFLLLPKWEN